jgi:hypothetical protein
MAYALETRRGESPAQAEGFAIADLWMLPILLLAMVFEKFSRHLVQLKDMRRARPMPRDWRSFYPELRRCEWATHWFCFEGARQIILGGDLDLAAMVLDPEPPEGFQPSMPRSALSMHRRMQDIARFHADPERWIRRHAARLARTCDCGLDYDRTSDSGCPVVRPVAVAMAVPVRIAIRGPPWDGASYTKSTVLNPLIPSARTRPHARKVVSSP